MKLKEGDNVRPISGPVLRAFGHFDCEIQTLHRDGKSAFVHFFRESNEFPTAGGWFALADFELSSPVERLARALE